MEELYSIMRDLLEVEYNQESLLRLLRAAEAAYSDKKQEEAKKLRSVKTIGSSIIVKKCGCLCFWVFCFYVACACDVVHRHIVKSGKNQEVINRDSCLAALIVCIGSLSYMQQVGNFLLS